MNNILFAPRPPLAVRAAGNYSSLRQERNVSANFDYRRFKDWREVLPDEHYCRIHRCCMIDLRGVVGFEPHESRHGGYAILLNGSREKISRGFVGGFHKATNYRFAKSPLLKRKRLRCAKRSVRKRARGGQTKNEHKTNTSRNI